MKAPGFWSKADWRSDALLPLSAVYGATVRYRRLSAVPYEVSVPLICIGNAIAGGAGKTPVALAVGEMLKQLGVNAWFVSRGYGGTAAGPVVVQGQPASEVGDEPLLLARCLPTVVAKDRVKGIEEAMAKGAQLVVLDDGYQDYRMQPDLALLVVDAAIGMGNGRLIPAGPLREPVAEAWQRADAVIRIGNATEQDAKTISANLQPKNAAVWQGQRVLAFAGIGYPEKFFRTLRTLGAELVEAVGFADHHAYTQAELQSLQQRAATAGAVLITTEKDAARLPAAWREHIHTLPVSLVFDQPERLQTLLMRAIKAHAKTTE